jgi:hypothetical protein
VPDKTIHEVIREAIAAPATWTVSNAGESAENWQAGAVVVALAVHGYQIIPEDRGTSR